MMLEFSINERSSMSRAPGSLGAHFDSAYREIAQWDGYAETPLHELHDLAQRSGVRHVLYKDESLRFGGLSFKALGGAYAVQKIVRDSKGTLTVAAATGGNHGASVAWAARRFGCACVLYISDDVAASRAQRLAALGARVVRVEGGYDSAVQRAEQDAAANGWSLVSDTSAHANDPVVTDVMAGYGVLARELASQLAQRGVGATHIFIPTGVGGLTAATIAYFDTTGARTRPAFIACEPEGAASVLLSIRSGGLTALSTVTTEFSCLACGRPSAAAWEILSEGLDAAVAVRDDEIREAQMSLRSHYAIAAGETAGAGLAAFARAAADVECRAALRIGADSVIVLIGTEGSTL